MAGYNRDKLIGYKLVHARRKIKWQRIRNKARELLSRGYHQDEIANTLHIIQPTISRDIHYIQKEIRESMEDYGEHLFDVYRNNLQGIDEMIKKLWTIVDSPRTDSKEKIKAVTLIGQYYRERLELVRSEPRLVQNNKWMNSVKRSSF